MTDSHTHLRAKSRDVFLATIPAATASRKYRYDLHTALYMLDPWERALFNTVLLVILAWSARLAAGSLFGGGSPAASQ